MATHSKILAWKIPWTEEPGGLVQRIAKSWTRLSEHTHTHTHAQREKQGCVCISFASVLKESNDQYIHSCRGNLKGRST